MSYTDMRRSTWGTTPPPLGQQAGRVQGQGGEGQGMELELELELELLEPSSLIPVDV